MGVEADFLRSVPLFRELDPKELAEVGRLFAERRYERGQVVFSEDDTGRFMYVVKEGRVKVSRWLPNGRELILAFHPAGDWFGEMSLIDGRTVPATITAVVPTTVLSLSRARFVDLLGRPPFVMALLRALAGRCREAWQQIEVLTHHHAEARIRMALHQLCQHRGTETPGGVRIEVPLTHRELASIAGVSRETVTRVLGHLVGQGLVAMEGRRFLVARPARLIESALLE